MIIIVILMYHLLYLCLPRVLATSSNFSIINITEESNAPYPT